MSEVNKRTIRVVREEAMRKGKLDISRFVDGKIAEEWAERVPLNAVDGVRR